MFSSFGNLQLPVRLDRTFKLCGSCLENIKSLKVISKEQSCRTTERPFASEKSSLVVHSGVINETSKAILKSNSDISVFDVSSLKGRRHTCKVIYSGIGINISVHSINIRVRTALLLYLFQEQHFCKLLMLIKI